VDFGQRLAIMSVYFAWLISFFILWRLLFVFLTSMHMFRYNSLSMSLISLLYDTNCIFYYDRLLWIYNFTFSLIAGASLGNAIARVVLV